MNKYISKHAILTFSLLTLLTFSTAVFGQTRTEVLIVADCTGVAEMKCLRIKKPQDEKWTLFYQNIENFAYVEGYTYILRVKVRALKNAPADASNLRYSLTRVLNREKTGSAKSSDDSNAAAPLPNYSELNGKIWQLNLIDGTAVGSVKATLIFDFDKNRVGGSGGCNGFGGTLAGEQVAIKISEIISTKMFCENSSEIENKYLIKLEQVNRYQLKDGQLQLYGNGKTVLEFILKK